MAYSNEFPHSRTFDSDLREILEMFEEFKRNFENIDEIIKRHLDEYIKEWEDKFLELEQKIAEQQDKFSKEINDYLATELKLIRNDFANLKESVSEDILDIRETVINMQAYVDAQNKLQDLSLADTVREIYKDMDELILKLPNILNPTNGLMENIEKVINDIYSVNRYNGLTASEYDALSLTATVYDNYALTAFIYDTEAKLRLA